MPVPTSITDLSKNASDNSPQGTESVKGTIDDYLRSHGAFIRQLSDLVSGPTVTLVAALTTNIGFAQCANIQIIGNSTIAAFDSVAEGALRFMTFTTELTLVHSGSLLLTGGADIITAPGDTALMKSLGNGNWKCLIFSRAGVRTPATGLLLSDAEAVLISQGGTGAATAAKALANLGGLPLIGGTMTGSIILSNDKGILQKDSNGVAASIFNLGADNNLNFRNAGGQNIRFYNQQGTSILFSIDAIGQATHSNKTTINTSQNGGGRNLELVSTTGLPEVSWVGASGAKSMRLNGTQLEWVNSAYSAVIATLSDAGQFAAAIITETSDERKKKAWQRLPGDFIDSLASIRKCGLFTWRRNGERGLGVGAQSLEKILPAAVYTDAKGGKTVQYGAAALVSAVELARAVVDLQARVAELEAR